MSKITAAITGIQGYVPDYILTNKIDAIIFCSILNAADKKNTKIV